LLRIVPEKQALIYWGECADQLIEDQSSAATVEQIQSASTTVAGRVLEAHAPNVVPVNVAHF
jgi:hypothetical protein